MAYRNDSSKDEGIKILYNEAMNITSIAHYARVQANDADLRARYCMSLAEKAMCEAESVHQVAESLTCTARMVANMTLDYISSIYGQNEDLYQDSQDISSEEKIIIETLKQMGQQGREQRVRSDYSESDNWESHGLVGEQAKTDPEGDREKELSPRQNRAVSREASESSYGILVNNVKIDQSNEVAIEKFQEQFPETLETKDAAAKDLPKEFDSSHSLPILFEDSYQGTRGTKPLSWAEKKNIRKMQRKLREIDLDGNELDHISESSADSPCIPEIVDGKLQYNSQICKETLLKSVRFLDEVEEGLSSVDESPSGASGEL